MPSYRLYHNPACSKSRAALALLQARGAEVEVVDYLAQPPGASELRSLARMLQLPASALLRADDGSGSSDGALTEDDVLALLQRDPARLQRPILVAGDRALIARPPERVLEWLPAAG